MTLYSANKQDGKKALFLSFSVLLLILIYTTVSLLFSVVQTGRAGKVLKTVLAGRTLSRREAVILGKPDPGIFDWIGKVYSDSEITAAALLLADQGYENLAEGLYSLAGAGDTPSARMSRSLLTNALTSREKWADLASFSAGRIREGESDPSVLTSFYKAVYSGDLVPSEFGLPVKEAGVWSCPVLERQGTLDRSFLIKSLLSASFTDIQNLFYSWDSPVLEDPGVRQVFRYRTLMEQQEYASARDVLDELWVNELEGAGLLPEEFLLALIPLFRRGERADTWLARLTEKGRDRDSSAAAFLTGSLAEREAQWERALMSYRNAAILADSDEEIRRSQWYELRLLIRQESSDSVLAFLRERVDAWDESDYFDDLLDEFYTLLIRSRQWKKLDETVSFLLDTRLRTPVAQGLYLLNQAVEARFLEKPDYLSGEILKEGLSRDPLGYYALLGSPGEWPFKITGQDSFSRESVKQEEGPDKVYKLLLQAGKEDLSWSLWNRRLDPLDPDTVAMFCNTFFREQDFFRCIRFAGYWFYRWPPDLAVNLIPWLYPVDGELPVREYSRQTGLPEELILGVIRRESAFNRTIESHAGAVGLMQVMPSTASDLASRYRMNDWDLQNPSDNIRLGSLYLNWLKERYWTGNLAEILIAYNGGGGNLRRWKRQSRGVPEQLFIQSIPYSETRNYVRKVIVAAGTYRYLNTGEPPAEWIEQFFLSFPAL